MAENRGVAPPDFTTDVGMVRANIGDVTWEEFDPPQPGFIYGLMCKCHPDSGIRYVGQTSRSVERRLRQHIWEANRTNRPLRQDVAVYRWIRKHGGHNIETVTLEERVDVSDLNRLETLWIDRLSTFRDNGGLNLTSGGGAGLQVSQETRQKMSDAWTEDRKAEHIKRLTGKPSPTKGVPKPLHIREQISKSKMGRKRDPETVRKMVATRVERGSNAGQRNGRSLITDETARTVFIDAWAQFKTMDEIAEQYQISNHMVQRIKYRKNWQRATDSVAKDLFDE